MTRAGKLPIAALVAAVFTAALLSACGSSDSSTTGATAAGGSQASGEGSQGEPSDSGEGGSQGSKPGNVVTPLKISGGGSEQFRGKGSDNSIQEFGEEADESELEAAAEATHGFFVARAEGEWAKACAYLSQAMAEQLEQLAASSTALESKGCAPFLEAFTTHLSDSAWREITTVDAGSLRTEDEQAFLIYYGADKAVYAMPLAREDDEWKVGALAGSPLS